MSESKARVTRELAVCQQQMAQDRQKLINLLRYVVEVQQDHPEVQWPDLPDTYSQWIWQLVA